MTPLTLVLSSLALLLSYSISQSCHYTMPSSTHLPADLTGLARPSLYCRVGLLGRYLEWAALLSEDVGSGPGGATACDGSSDSGSRHRSAAATGDAKSSGSCPSLAPSSSVFITTTALQNNSSTQLTLNTLCACPVPPSVVAKEKEIEHKREERVAQTIMAPLKAGDKFPAGVQFEWVPIKDDDPKVCGIPQTYDADKEWKGKKVVLVSVPGAFTPGCQAFHLPPYVEKLSEFKGKGVDIVAFIAYNDAWVMSAWGKINGVKGDDLLLLSDTKTHFSKEYGWQAGERNGRWAMVIEKDGSVSYAEVETAKGVTVSGAEAVYAKL